MATKGYFIPIIVAVSILLLLVVRYPQVIPRMYRELDVKVTGAIDVKREYNGMSAFKPPVYTDLNGERSVDGITLLHFAPVNFPMNMSYTDKHDAIINIAQQPQAICHNWALYGNKVDGGWPVCLAPKLLPKPPCVVYSYGINYEWSFDAAYHKEHNCTIRTFDPSMGKTVEHEHYPGVFFYPIGLSDRTQTRGKWKLYSHKEILRRFQEDNIILPYLKFDVESYEFQVLHNMIKDGVLKNVMQLSFEIHVKNPIYGKGSDANVKHMFDAVKGLEALGFRRWFYHHRLNGFPFQCDQAFININFL